MIKMIEFDEIGIGDTLTVEKGPYGSVPSVFSVIVEDFDAIDSTEKSLCCVDQDGKKFLIVQDDILQVTPSVESR